MSSRFFHISILLKMLLLCPLLAVGQAVDSSIAVPQGKTRITYLNNLNHSPDLLLDIDSTLAGLQREYNPYYMQNLGNLGSPAFPLVWQAPQVSGFKFGFNQWDFLRLTSQNIGYYNTQNPFSELSYTQGSAREKLQVINALHTQNILPNWNVALRLKREGSIGYYEQQNTRNGNFGLNTWYRSPNRRYLVAASGIYNNFTFEENGGLRDADLFQDTALTDRQRLGLPFFLRDARQAFTDKDFNVQQFLYFGPTETRRARSDSDSVSVTVLKPRFYLMHQANYYTQNYSYRDTLPTLLFYPQTSDTLITRDVYGYDNFSNKIGFGYTFTDSALTRNYSLQAYLKYDYITTKLKRPEYDSRYDNTSIGFNGQKLGKFNVAFSGELVLAGYNGGDFFADVSTSAGFFPSLKMS
ncbi:MAG: putative porin, partial [Bacteroidia bacterium]